MREREKSDDENRKGGSGAAPRPAGLVRADMDRFQALLDDQNDWPGEYLFKFIVPRSGLDEITALFGDSQFSVRASRRGNYVSVSARIVVASSDEVVAIYLAAGEVEGVISL